VEQIASPLDIEPQTTREVFDRKRGRKNTPLRLKLSHQNAGRPFHDPNEHQPFQPVLLTDERQC
jgi:hypothetical protein